MRNPKIFLFDEPLSNLDAKLRVQMRIEIKRLQRKIGVTSIYVTHDQTEAMTLADRLAVINDGRIEQMGAPMELYHDPKTLFVASFIGSPQINLLPARFEEGKLVSGDLALDGFSDLPEGTDLVMGVRPDDLSLKPGGQLAMDVELVEQHGADNLIYGTLRGGDSNGGAGTEFCFKTGHETRPALDEMITLHFEPARAFVFRKDTGERLI